MAEAGKEPSSLGGLTNIGATANKMWDDKLSEASRAWEEQLRSAEAALDKGIGAASQAVRAGLSAAGRESSAAKSRLQQFYDTGAAHFQAAEQQAFEALGKGVRWVTVDHPQVSLAAGVVAAGVLLPAPRKFLLRQTLGRFRSEEAVYRSAELRYKGLKDSVEGQHGELQKLQERLSLAEVEYERGLAKLKSTARELESLGGRVHSSSKAARVLLDDLRTLPSKQALQLRSDAANAAATAANQGRAVQKALKRVAKHYGL